LEVKSKYSGKKSSAKKKES
jgi:hypothetical protein